MTRHMSSRKAGSRIVRTGALLAWLVCLLCAAALGVVPHRWRAQSEADFNAGEHKDAAATSRGELILAREIKVLMPSTDAPAVVSAVVAVGNTVYAGSGNTNVVYRIQGGKSHQLAKPPGTMITSMLWRGKELLVGTGGKDAGVYRIDTKGTVKPLFANPKIKYVWALVPAPGGVIYAATGPDGIVMSVDSRGRASIVFQAGGLAKNILCLALGKNGKLYAGTDENGLILEIDPHRKSSRVLYDADEKEISALIVDAVGGVYASTADAAKASPDGSVQKNGAKTGKSVSPAKTPASGKSTTSKPGAAKPPAKPKAVVVVRRPSTPPAATPPAPTLKPTPSAQGNAVYYVAPDGLVTTRFRKPVTILAMLLHDDKLILGTGNGGMVYSVTTDGDETVPLADTDAKQITALAGGGGGKLVFASANKGSVGTIGPSYAKKGTFTSKALDAKQIAQWGSLQAYATTPPGTKATIAARSGNVSKPEDKTWANWSKEQPCDGEYRPIMAPAGRFLQFRLTLTGNGKVTPVVEEVYLVHQVGNLPPVFAGLSVLISEMDAQNKPAPTKAFRHIAMQAADPNGDRIVYNITFREAGSENWIEIAKDLTQPKYVWDTRTVGDGRYQLLVTAKDSPSNPEDKALLAARASDPIVIDNTAPLVQGLRATAERGRVTVTGTAADAGTRILAMYYSIDSQTTWKPVLPTDGICDSPRERFTFTITDVQRGAHRIAVKAYDLYGNIGFGATTVVSP